MRTKLQKNATLSFKIYSGRGNNTTVNSVKKKKKLAKQIDQIIEAQMQQK